MIFSCALAKNGSSGFTHCIIVFLKVFVNASHLPKGWFVCRAKPNVPFVRLVSLYFVCSLILSLSLSFRVSANIQISVPNLSKPSHFFLQAGKLTKVLGFGNFAYRSLFFNWQLYFAPFFQAGYLSKQPPVKA
jgi:hypothetical protein